MKKFKSVSILFIFAVMLVALLAMPKQSIAQSIDVTGGIQNEYQYEEYIFLTGKPVKFTGTSNSVSVTSKESKGKLIETYKFTLTGPNKEKLTRNFTYTYDVENYDQIGQSTATGEVTKFTEKIVIGEKTFTLADYQLSKSTVTDKRPASDYYAGEAIARKTYTVAKDGKEKVIVSIESRNEGYENFWGATETQITDYNYTFQSANGTIQEGTVVNTVSTTKSRTTEYNKNTASLSSFNGNYKTISSADTVSNYEYELPTTSGTVALDIAYMPKVEMLKIPKFRDLASNWAKYNIESLYALGILDDDSNFFSPSTPMLRYDFAIAIGKAIDIRVLEEITTKKSKKTTTKAVFNDVSKSKKDYEYLLAATQKGVITGVSATKFLPDSFLTREQAATILIRALGLEEKAPDPGYRTNFNDDYKISDFARDSVYMANELGLMSGSYGNFNPTGTLTRAEASAIIDRFLNHLEANLKQNYRDDIINF
jgi:hypothetical protein